MSDTEKQVSTIAVLGAGSMGHGIAHAAIAAGYTTYLFDVSRTQLDRGAAGIEAIFQKRHRARQDHAGRRAGHARPAASQPRR